MIDPNSKATAWTATEDSFCIVCHSGGNNPLDPGLPPGVKFASISIDTNGVPCDAPSSNCAAGSTLVSAMRPQSSCDYMTSPWWTQFTWDNSAHSKNSKRGWPGYSAAPAAELACTTCHDPHGSYTSTNTAGNPYMIRDFLDGTLFVDDGERNSPNWLGPPWNTFGTSREVVVTVAPGANPPPAGSDPAILDWAGPTGLCSVCHSKWVNATNAHLGGTCFACQICHNHGADWGENDWGVTPPNDSTSCAECGNGILEGLEECDDANQVSGDGCSNECTIE